MSLLVWVCGCVRGRGGGAAARRRTLALPTLPPCADERRPSAYARATAIAARQVHRKLVRRVFLRRYGPEYESRSEEEAAERTVALSAECADEGHAQRNDMCTTWLLAARSYMLKRVVTVHCFQTARCAQRRSGSVSQRDAALVARDTRIGLAAREWPWLRRTRMRGSEGVCDR